MWFPGLGWSDVLSANLAANRLKDFTQWEQNNRIYFSLQVSPIRPGKKIKWFLSLPASLVRAASIFLNIKFQNFISIDLSFFICCKYNYGQWRLLGWSRIKGMSHFREKIIKTGQVHASFLFSKRKVWTRNCLFFYFFPLSCMC